jgi:hypothetical protein
MSLLELEMADLGCFLRKKDLGPLGVNSTIFFSRHESTKNNISKFDKNHFQIIKCPKHCFIFL